MSGNSRRRLPQATYSRKNTDRTYGHKRRRILTEVDDGTDNMSSDAPLSSSNTLSSSCPPKSALDSDAPSTSQKSYILEVQINVPAPSRSKPLQPNQKLRLNSPKNIPDSFTRKTSAKLEKPREKLTQLRLDLGQAVHTTCRQCGMNYLPSDTTDASVHRRFHAKSVGGVDVSPTLQFSRVIWKDGNGESCIAVVDRRSSPAEKRKAKEVLELVESELSAAEIPEKNLWSAERYRIYLYITAQRVSGIGGGAGGSKKCVGLLLAERIEFGYGVAGGNSPTPGGNVVLETNSKRKAVLGVARVWTCLTSRRIGIARALLDSACESFVYGMRVKREWVAFSQPTESGEKLARGWFFGTTAMAEDSKGALDDGKLSNSTITKDLDPPSPISPPLVPPSPQIPRNEGWLVYVG